MFFTFVVMKIPVKNSVLSLKQFLLSQYFYDGLKITFGVVLPSIICYQFGLLEAGITISLGALFVSITDNPGPVMHKRNAMIVANVLIFAMAVLIGFTNRSTWLLALEIPLCCFVFSMFTVYGLRASSVGIAALLVLVIGIDQHLDPFNTWMHALSLLTGGLWYMLFSLSFSQMIPYRPAQQILGECIHQVAEFIRIKGDFYDVHKDADENQTRQINQQILVAQSLDNVREILFKTRKLLRDSSVQGNVLIMSFIELVDLYEQTMESHHDYSRIRSEYDPQMLKNFQRAIHKLANELEYIGRCIHNHELPQRKPRTEQLLLELKSQLETREMQGQLTLSLKKILVNLRNILQRMQQIYSYQQEKTVVPEQRKKELHRYVSHQTFDWKLFRENLSFRSAVFRHSVRVSLVCLAAFLFARHFYIGHHSYWILLTILVILKPGFSQTKKRNYERIVGTLAGGLLGILILYIFKDTSTRFWLLLLLMLLTYSFIRIRYVVSVFFMTPFILIMFSFIGHSNDMLLVQERILDTFIGAAVAFLASYFIFPIWESAQIRTMMSDMLQRNLEYLKSVTAYDTTDLATHSNYRIARKEMYVSTSNLASAFQRMLSEPKQKRQYVNEANKFILLNNLFSSHVATLAYAVKQNDLFSQDQVKELRKVFHLMQEAYTALVAKPMQIEEPTLQHTTDTFVEKDEAWAQLVNIAGELKKMSLQIGEQG